MNTLPNAGACPEGILCCYAHSLAELRVVAAIQKGLLPRDFKTALCSTFEAGRRCPDGELDGALALAVPTKAINLAFDSRAQSFCVRPGSSCC